MKSGFAGQRPVRDAVRRGVATTPVARPVLDRGRSRVGRQQMMSICRGSGSLVVLSSDSFASPFFSSASPLSQAKAQPNEFHLVVFFDHAFSPYRPSHVRPACSGPV